MAAPSPQNGIISGINVTPLVDITLVLLIVFIVTAKLIVTPAVPLDLPQASQSEEVQVVFSVIVPLSGPVLINGAPATDDEAILRSAKDALAKNPELRAVINGDGAIPYRTAIHMLDLLKNAGVSRVAFGSVPLENGGK